METKEKVSLKLYSKYQTHPEVNFGTLEVILRSFEVKMHFFKALCSSMDKLPNKEKSKPQFKCQTHPEVNFGH